MSFTKLYCDNCKTAFDEDELEPIYTMEGEGVMRGPLFDHFECPECGSEVYDEAVQCPVCEEYYNGEEDYCENCQKAIHEQNDDFIKSVQDYFNLDYGEAIELMLFDLVGRLR